MPPNNTRIVFTRKMKAELEPAPIETRLRPNQVLIKNHYCLISPGTELALYTQSHIGFGDPKVPWATYPAYPGYAAAGRVEAVGQNVTRFAVGDALLTLGRHQAYDVIPQDDLAVKIPSDVPLASATFGVLAQIANTARWVSQVQPGETVAVIGQGLVGNLAAQLFQVAGAAVIGLDLMPFRRDLAHKVGIHQVIDPDTDLTDAIRLATGGGGADTVVEATGNPDLVTPALQAVRSRGEVILLGSPRGATSINVYWDIHKNGAALRGAHVGILPRIATDGSPDRQGIIGDMLALIQQRRLTVEPLISETIQPTAIDAAYRALLEERDRVLAIVIDWT